MPNICFEVTVSCQDMYVCTYVGTYVHTYVLLSLSLSLYVILGVFLTVIRICHYFTINDIVFLKFMSISFHWELAALMCVFINKKYTISAKSSSLLGEKCS